MSEGETITVENKRKQPWSEERRERQKLTIQKRKESKLKPNITVAPEIIIPKVNIKPFGDVDKDVKGKLRSEMPAWYLTEAKEELDRKIKEQEKALEDDAIPQQSRARFREDLRNKKDRLEKIRESEPSLKGNLRDSVVKMREEMATELREAHPKNTDRTKGLVDTHEEARRMKEPVIKIKNDQMADFAKECGVRIIDGKISRDSGDKMWKIMSKMLNEPTDVEYLRRG